MKYRRRLFEADDEDELKDLEKDDQPSSNPADKEDADGETSDLGGKGGQNNRPVQKTDPQDTPPEKPKKPLPQSKPKKTPAQKKDDRFKFEMTYLNGGFNNGVQVKPDKGGKALLEISIYGGGEKKSLSISPLPSSIAKLVQAYELSTDQESDAPEITQELQKYFDEIRNVLSMKIIEIFKDADHQVEQAIKETFKSINSRF